MVGSGRRRAGALTTATVAAVLSPIAAGMFAAPDASAAPKEPAGLSRAVPLSQPPAAAFPPKANSAWAYDTSSPGTWVKAIKSYNQNATPGHRLNEIYSYATDLEMYCPDNDGTQCNAGDLYSYYTPGGTGRARTDAYYQAFDAAKPGSLIISPIIDGRTDAQGYLQGFNELSPGLAAGFAD